MSGSPAVALGDAPASRWFARRPSRAGARIDLFALAHAGAGASAFFDWSGLLPGCIDLAALVLPGREERWREPFFTSTEDLTVALTSALVPRISRPYVLFGHSMGALIWFNVARRLRLLGAPAPAGVIVSGHRSPHLPLQRRALAGLPEAEFVQEIRKLGGTAEEVLDDPSARSYFLSILRADLALCESYRYADGLPLACPVVAYYGREDENADEAATAAWRAHTTGRFWQRGFDGGHFFLRSARDATLAALVGDVLRLVEP